MFRTFRLLRVFKLARSWKSLSRLMVTVGKTLWGVYPFSILLCIFIYIFAVSGLHLFGASFVLDFMVEDMETGGMVQNSEFDCTEKVGNFITADYIHCPPRANYDTFLWALITTFQVG